MYEPSSLLFSTEIAIAVLLILLNEVDYRKEADLPALFGACHDMLMASQR